MNNDRELLELAAKAAGIKISQWSNAQAGGFLPGGRGDFWNPLTDDADALRLAVKLGIDVEINYSSGNFDGSTKACMNKDWYVERAHKGNPKAATCRAIVCAAAEIGKELP